MVLEIIENKWKEYVDVKNDLKNECIAYFKDFLNTMGTDKYIIKDNINITNFYEANGSPSIGYDGGNHPEYATNPYSTLHGIGIKDGNVYFVIEDCEEYDISRVWTVDELVYIIDALEWCKTHKEKIR